MLAVHHPPLRVQVPIVTIPHLTSAAAMACDLCATLFIIGAPLDVLRCASPTPACSQENYVITQNARALNKHNNHAITHSNPTEHASITTMKWTTNDQQQQQHQTITTKIACIIQTPLVTNKFWCTHFGSGISLYEQFAHSNHSTFLIHDFINVFCRFLCCSDLWGEKARARAITILIMAF